MIQVSSGIEVINHGSNIDYLYGPYVFDPPQSEFPDEITSTTKFKRLAKEGGNINAVGTAQTLFDHLLQGTEPQTQSGRTFGIAKSLGTQPPEICEYWINGGKIVKKQPKIDLPDSVEFYNEYGTVILPYNEERDLDEEPSKAEAVTPYALKEWDGSYYSQKDDEYYSNLTMCTHGYFGAAATKEVSAVTNKKNLGGNNHLIPEATLKTLLNHGMGFKSCEVSTTENTPWTVHLAHLTRKQVDGVNGNDQITLLLQASHYTVNNQIGLISISARRRDAIITWFPKWDLENTREETEFFQASELYLGPANETGPWDLYLTTTYKKAGNHYLSVQILSDPNDDVTLKMSKVDSRPEAAVKQTKVAIPTSVPKYSGGSHIKVSSENAISLANSVMRSNNKPIPLRDSGNVALLELVKITKQPQGYRGTLLITGKGLWNGTENAGNTIITWSINSNASDGDSVGISALNLPGYWTDLSSIQYILKINDVNSFSIFAQLPSQYSSYNVIAFDSFAEFATGDYITVASANIKESNVLFQFAKNAEEYKKIPNTAVESVPLYTRNDMTNSISDQYHMGGNYPATKALTPDALAYWDGSYNVTTNSSGVSVHQSRLAHCSLGQFGTAATHGVGSAATLKTLVNNVENSNANLVTQGNLKQILNPLRGNGLELGDHITNGTKNIIDLQADTDKILEATAMAYWDGRFRNNTTIWSNLMYCNYGSGSVGRFQNGAVTTIPTNASSRIQVLSLGAGSSTPIIGESAAQIWRSTTEKETILGNGFSGTTKGSRVSINETAGTLEAKAGTGNSQGKITLSTTGIALSGEVTANNKITAASFYESSDARLKDAQSSNLTLDQITSIPLVNFTWKDKRDLKHHLGTIAQDVQEIAPEIVDKDADGMLSVEYDKLGVLAIDAVRQLKEIVDKQADMIKQLQDQIQTLKEKK